LLTAAGFLFDSVPADVDERCLPGESPEAYVRRLAQEKSARGLELWSTGRTPAMADSLHAAKFPDRPVSPLAAARLPPTDVVVLGADTTVVVDDEIFGKAVDAADARRMLGRLSGRKHYVLTGISLRCGGVEISSVEITMVEFARMSEVDVDWYTRSGEWVDKAGAYAIQGLASCFVTRIEGSYSNVVGLPVAAVSEQLRRAGWVVGRVESLPETG